MDHVGLLNEVRAIKTLRAALDYAIYDRTHGDYYFDYFELEHAISNRDSILVELQEELARPEEYIARQAYAFYPPKNSLCYRRMVYIPLKDLVVRYAFCIILSEYIDPQLANTCFANRRATGDRRAIAFTEDFAADSWPRFCAWQRERATEARVLLRTDISSFFDSVSHDYLIDALARELGVSRTSQLLRMFGKLLQAPVVSYSYLDSRVGEQEPTKQGLLIGNGTEGFLANVYLKAIDEQMAATTVRFARYNDDMRIFSQTRQEAEHAILILQQLLLTKGLNLNASKTKIAEGPAEIAKLQSKDADAYAYACEDDRAALSVRADEETVLDKHVDRDFDDFRRIFSPGEQLKEDSDAKDFCKFLGQGLGHSSRTEARAARSEEQICLLAEILRKWQGSARHASWLLVESASYSDVPDGTRRAALKCVLESLDDQSVSYYARYRLLHQLIRPRATSTGTRLRLTDQLDKSARERLHDVALECLAEPAFELALVAMYALCALGDKPQQVASIARDRLLPPYPSAIAAALGSLSDYCETTISSLWATTEPDGLVGEY